MKVIGIIAEYNPFHNGHAYQIDEIRRRTGADYVVAAMSGDFVQRGAPAVIDKYARAQMALSCGIDLVLELPTLWATASAESFAAAGVALFEKMGCVDGICFGAECDDLSLLSNIADILVEEPSDYRGSLSSYLREGLTFPQARARALTDTLTCQKPSAHKYDTDSSEAAGQSFFLTQTKLAQALGTPNNILAIEYLKAIRRQKSALTPYLIKREGAGYHDTVICDTGSIPVCSTDSAVQMTAAVSATIASAPTASATAIREVLSSGTSADCASFCAADMSDSSALPAFLSAELSSAMPPAALSVLSDYLKEKPSVWSDDFSSILGYLLLSATPETLASYGDCNMDIANRLYKNRFSYRSLSQFCEWNKSRDITYTRMSRILFHLLLGIRDADYATGKEQGYIPYLKMLGFRKDSSALLRELKDRATVPVISKLADAKTQLKKKADSNFASLTCNTQEQFAAALLHQDIFAADLYEQIASQKKGTTPRSEFTREIVRL